MKDGDIADTIVGRLEQTLREAGVGDRQVRTKMSNICGITTQAIAQWFNGQTSSPSAENIAAIAAFYGADLMWVITGDPNGPTRVQEMLTALVVEREMALERKARREKKTPPMQKPSKTSPKKSPKMNPKTQHSLTLVVS